MDAAPEDLLSKALLPVVAVVVFLLLIFIARGVRRIFRWISRTLARWMGRRPARALGWVIAAVLVVGLVSGVIVDGIIGLTDRIFAIRDTTTSETAVQPTTSLRSGGPGSLVAWDSLGYQGRNFAGEGPTASRHLRIRRHRALNRFAHTPASRPPATPRIVLGWRFPTWKGPAGSSASTW